MVSIIKVHNDDPEEPYFTIQLADGTEKQTVKKYLGSYAFSPFKKENIFDEEFWNLKQLNIKGKLYAYSRTTRLILALHIEEGGSNRAMELYGIRGEGDTIIRGRKIPKEILKWCLAHKIQVFKNKCLYWF